MARRDFVTTSDEEDGAAVRSSSPPGYQNPQNMILVVDPALVPDELVEQLLSPDQDGHCRALLTDRPFAWYPTDKRHLEIELRANNWLVNGSCAICGGRTDPGGLDPFWEGRDVCNECMPDELTELQSIGYDYADKAAEQSSDGAEIGWWQALERYARELKEGRPS